MVAPFRAALELKRVSDIFTEVDEDLRRDRALKLWQKYGNYILAAAVVIVVGTASFVAWRDYDRRQAEAGAIKFVTALDQARAQDPAAGVAALETVVREAPAGYAALARLHEAAFKARSDPAAAAEQYRSIAVDTRVAAEIRNAATLLAALNAIEADPAAVERQVTASTTPGNAWRHAAWEVAALAAAKAGNNEQARALYTRIADDPEAPAGLRGRAAEMLAALGS
jgi:hypothetical protein